MLRACEYCVGSGEKVFGHYDRTDQKYFGHCAKNSVNDRQMTEKKNLDPAAAIFLVFRIIVNSRNSNSERKILKLYSK